MNSKGVINKLCDYSIFCNENNRISKTIVVHIIQRFEESIVHTIQRFEESNNVRNRPKSSRPAITNENKALNVL